MFAIKLDYALWLEGFNPDGGHLGTHKPAHAQKFASRADAERFIVEHGLSAGARVVKFNDIRGRGDL